MVDNLNIHTPAVFYECFPPEQAHRLARRIEFCYTPVHGSWLNMAEIEISALVRQCLGKRRIPDAEILRREARGGLVRGAQPAGRQRGVAFHNR